MKKAHKKKTRRPKRELSEKQIRRLQEESGIRASKDTLLLAVAAMADELKLDDEQIGKVATRLGRYSKYLDDHTVRIKEVKEIIERQTGIKFA